MAKKLSDIMLDIETLSTRADGVILSIGAIKFDPNSDVIDDVGFYSSITIDSNTLAGRHISASTLGFWLKQSAEAQVVFTEKKVDLADALNDFAAFFDHADYKVWGNGASFDVPMVAHAFETHGAETPWKFWNSRCFRTIKNMPFATRAVKIENGLKHHALSDAIAQAKQLQEYSRVIGGVK
jgi:DNA polymerase III epsilon subunit-like protein